MKRLIFSLLILAGCAIAQVSGQPPMPSGSVLPATCNPLQINPFFFLTAGGPIGTPKACTAVNTWTSMTGGSGSQTWPAAPGIMVYAGGTSFGTSLAAPTGAIVGIGQTNAFGAFLQDFSASTWKVPTASGFVATANSMLGLDSGTGFVHIWHAAADKTFGTSAFTNTGTSGHTVPFLDGANTFSGTQSGAGWSITAAGAAAFNTAAIGTTVFDGTNASLPAGGLYKYVGPPSWNNPCPNDSGADGSHYAIQANTGLAAIPYFFCFVPGHANTGAAPGLIVTGASAFATHPITKNGTVALDAGDLVTTETAFLYWDGTEFQLLNPATAVTAAQLALKAPLISPSFTTPALGTPSSGDASNLTNIPVNQAKSGAALPVANGGTGSAFFAVAGPASTTKTYTFPNANATIPQTIASGATTASGAGSLNNLGSIASTACATLTVSATGVLTTDVISLTPNASIKAVVGFTPATTGGMTLTAYPTADNINIDACNWSTGPLQIGTGAVLNYRVTR